MLHTVQNIQETKTKNVLHFTHAHYKSTIIHIMVR